MPQPNDLSRSLVALDQDSTIIETVGPSRGGVGLSRAKESGGDVERGQFQKSLVPLRGTEGSNPPPSCAESVANLTFGGASHR